jgi:hypothetical protein
MIKKSHRLKEFYFKSLLQITISYHKLTKKNLTRFDGHTPHLTTSGIRL